MPVWKKCVQCRKHALEEEEEERRAGKAISSWPREMWDVGRGGGKNWKQIQSGEDEKEKEEEERLHIHIWWCGGFHGTVHGYGDT